eukprot:tig00000655_g2850.t1
MEGGRRGSEDDDGRGPNKRPRLVVESPPAGRCSSDVSFELCDRGAAEPSNQATPVAIATVDLTCTHSQDIVDISQSEQQHQQPAAAAAAAPAAQQLDSAAAPPPPRMGRTMQLMVESHVESGRPPRPSLAGSVGLPSSSAGMQRLWGGSRTLSFEDWDLPLADVGIRGGHGRTLRHFLAAAVGASRALLPELAGHLAEGEPSIPSPVRKMLLSNSLVRARCSVRPTPTRPPTPTPDCLGAALLGPPDPDSASPAARAYRRSVVEMTVAFRGEAAHGPGVLREYPALLAAALLDPHAALFRPLDDAPAAYYPSSAACVHPCHLNMFRLCGWAMGAAVATGSVFPVYFPECVYGYLLGRAPGLGDLASVEPAIARALERLLQHEGEAGGAPPGAASDLGMVFAVDELFFGAHRTVPLRPGGEAEPVTDANKYVRLAVEYYLVGRVQKKLEALREGLRRVLPAAVAAAALLPGELRAMVEGRAEVDVADWRRHTRYGNGLSADSQKTAWFWEYVEALPAAGRGRLLAFAMGRLRAPPGGFAHLVASRGRLEPFQLVREDREEPGRLPIARTCFNQLVLPRYASAGALRAAPDAAIAADHGFGFA